VKTEPAAETPAVCESKAAIPEVREAEKACKQRGSLVIRSKEMLSAQAQAGSSAEAVVFRIPPWSAEWQQESQSHPSVPK